MEASDIYRWLMEGGERAACEAFDAHVVASVLAMAVIEGQREGRQVAECLGLEGAALVAWVEDAFPHAVSTFARLAGGALAPADEHEQRLRALLRRFAAHGAFAERLADVVARRCLRPDALWRELGLRNPREVSWLMERHFESLAQRNARATDWKAFLDGASRPNS
ncbi:MAG: nitrogen fixation protein NifQ [Magnetospirillum sp.]|nr:nitrogen fixation protein NifQ [Magnetospirillum sp.]